MTKDEIAAIEPIARTQSPQQAPSEQPDPKQRALALGLEFSKRALEAESLDDLFFMLTNDIRTLVEFDRAFLLTHLEGRSQLAAAGNQPILEKKSKFYAQMNRLARKLRNVERGILLSGTADTASLPDDEVPTDVKEELAAFMEFSQCSFFLCVPLKHNDALLGHLVLEFLDKNVPRQIEILTLFNLGSLFGAALAEKWLAKRKPAVASFIYPDAAGRRNVMRFFLVTLPLAILVVVGLVCLLFYVPLDSTVGGEAEVVPRDKHVAFAQIDGLVEKVFAREGAGVEEGQPLAVLDRKELDFEISSSERRFDIHTKEMLLLRRESGQDPSKLAESKLVQLKRQSAWEELQFLKWKAQFLVIKAPVSGIVVTREVESLAGKKFKAGEPFCEIAVPGELWVEILVPEDRITFVRKGQTAEVFLNSAPGTPCKLRIAEISPLAEVVPRLGNVYRVRGPFPDASPSVKVGMKGIGKIFSGRERLYRILAHRLQARWNQLSIYF